MKRFSLLLIILTGGFWLPFSCDYMTSKYGPSTYLIDSLSIKSGQIDISQFRYSFTEIDFDSVTTDTLVSSSFGLQLSIESVNYITRSTNAPCQYGLISSSMADPAPPRSKSKLSLMSVYSDEVVLANGLVFEAGDNLAGLFKVSTGYGDPQDVLKYLEYNYEWYQWDSILLHFSATLDQPLSQILKVKITMDDGVVFDLETSRVVVK